MKAKRFEKSALAGAWHSSDADAARVAGVGQAGVEQFGCKLGIGAARALHKRDGAREDIAVAGENAIAVLG